MIGVERARSRDVATGIVLGAATGLSALFLYLDSDPKRRHGRHPADPLRVDLHHRPVHRAYHRHSQRGHAARGRHDPPAVIAQLRECGARRGPGHQLACRRPAVHACPGRRRRPVVDSHRVDPLDGVAHRACGHRAATSRGVCAPRWWPPPSSESRPRGWASSWRTTASLGTPRARDCPSASSSWRSCSFCTWHRVSLVVRRFSGRRAGAILHWVRVHPEARTRRRSVQRSDVLRFHDQCVGGGHHRGDCRRGGRLLRRAPWIGFPRSRHPQRRLRRRRRRQPDRHQPPRRPRVCSHCSLPSASAR